MKYKKYIRKGRVFIRGVISSLLFKVFHRGGFDMNETMVIFGTTRSGSTWLAEIVSSVSGHCQIFEPLNRQYVKQAKKANIEQNHYILPDSEWRSIRRFFESIFSGKLMNAWLASQIPIKRVMQTRRLVVKIVRGNLLMGWICQNLPILPPALIIRHPCAVISSQLNKGWEDSLWFSLNNPYFFLYPDIREKCKQLSKPEELAALAWCIRYHAPLSLEKPYPYTLICYERLVRKGSEEVEPLFKSWNLELTDDVKKQFNIASDTSTQDSNISKGRDPLAGWTNKLTEEQITNILNVVKIFGMDFYTTNLEPDYEKLANFSSKASN